MYVKENRTIYETYMKLHQKSTNFMLSIFSVLGGMNKCFVSDSGTRGKKDWNALF